MKYVQALTGDSTDTIGGIPGVGIKTACSILDGCKEEWEYHDRCFKAYAEHYGNGKLGGEKYIENLNLVTILQEDRYNVLK